MQNARRRDNCSEKVSKIINTKFHKKRSARACDEKFKSLSKITNPKELIKNIMIFKSPSLNSSNENSSENSDQSIFIPDYG